eukprot:1161233-Pelagomonas_calceolata.AAC.5
MRPNTWRHFIFAQIHSTSATCTSVHHPSCLLPTKSSPTTWWQSSFAQRGRRLHVKVSSSCLFKGGITLLAFKDIQEENARCTGILQVAWRKVPATHPSSIRD